MARVSQKQLKNSLQIGLVLSPRVSKWLGFTATLTLEVDKLCAFILKLHSQPFYFCVVRSIRQQEQLNTPGG